jgi:predicted small integral membrane protein
MAGAFRQIALLVSQMREWAKAHNVKNKELAGMLWITTPRHNRNFLEA